MFVKVRRDEWEGKSEKWEVKSEGGDFGAV